MIPSSIISFISFKHESSVTLGRVLQRRRRLTVISMGWGMGWGSLLQPTEGLGERHNLSQRPPTHCGTILAAETHSVAAVVAISVHKMS